MSEPASLRATPSLWDSRFIDEGSRSVAFYRHRGNDEDVDVGQILAAARNELPFIGPHALTVDQVLGSGGTFQVDRELMHMGDRSVEVPRYVAVKRLVTRNGSDRELQSRLKSFLRELRVLTEPQLRAHACIISTLGYGWSTDPWTGSRPYLVMQYSDHGTLTHYLTHISVNFEERRELALDVALALKSLHASGIVHGDVKPDNVLIFDNLAPDEVEFHPQIAKLADFGCAIFEEELRPQSEVYYLGTTKYNAPEIRQLQKDSRGDLSTFESYKAADCYSFGLLLFEVARNGAPFPEGLLLTDPSTWYSWEVEGLELRAKESFQDYLDRLSLEHEDAILLAAAAYYRICKTMYDDHSTPKDPGRKLNPARHLEIVEVWDLTSAKCLKDRPSERGTMTEIVDTLSHGTSQDRSLASYPSRRSLPFHFRHANLRTISLKDYPRNDTYFRLGSVGTYSDHLSIRVVPIEAPSDPSLQMVRFNPQKPYEVSSEAHRPYTTVPDLSQAAMRSPPPWDVQSDTVSSIAIVSRLEHDPEQRAYAHLQLATAYHTGYGVQPNMSSVIFHLREASQANNTARSIFKAAEKALRAEAIRMSQTNAQLERVASESGSILDDNTETQHAQADNELTFGPIQGCTLSNLTASLDAGKHGQSVIYEGLVQACKSAHLAGAAILARYCAEFPLSNEPNPLHWLVNYESPDALVLLDIFRAAPTGSDTARDDLCRSMLAHQSGRRIIDHERCMEFFGTPLHWAVIAGDERLVIAYLDLGADINIRLENDPAMHGEPEQLRYPSFSSLDLAVAYHRHRIVQVLLERGGAIYGGDASWSYSPFQMIGHDLIPLARFAAHGEDYQVSVRQTIRVLQEQGLDINKRDTLLFPHTPLVWAAINLNTEEYILQELIAAGAKDDTSDGNVLIQAIRCCRYRRFSAYKARLLSPLVENINAIDVEGYGALHYAAIYNSCTVIDELITNNKLDIDVLTSTGHTALQLAAQRGCVGSLDSLIRGGAALEFRGPIIVTTENALEQRQGRTALELAVIFRHVDAVALLTSGGAKTTFQSFGLRTKSTVLHAAVESINYKAACVKKILDLCPNLRSHDSLNEYDDQGYTPLYTAVLFGDVDGVEALLEAGADHLKHRTHIRLTDGIIAHTATPLDRAIKILASAKISVEELNRDVPREVMKMVAERKTFLAHYLARVEEIKDILVKHSKSTGRLQDWKWMSSGPRVIDNL